ncbi:MAG: protein-L-isoaspartate(D-aspartate) O-methyltransferase [Solirubrobacterales bacterium]
MVERQLRRRGIGDERVLAAMAEVPRERFVSERLGRRAYADSALPIGESQTISQPWIVAAICQGLELQGGETVLEVGTGSGYSAAVLARLAARVISIERVAELAEQARRTLHELGVDNVEVRVGDGTRGAPDQAPFEAIAVHATAPAPPQTLLGQLADGGRLVIPLADDGVDLLTAFERHGDEVEQRVIAPCRFVPLVGEEGYGER